MGSEPDLTAELGAAEDIVTGRVAKVVTEWGWREPDGSVFELRCLGEEAAWALTTRRQQRGIPAVLVRRMVTYSPWEEVPDA